MKGSPEGILNFVDPHVRPRIGVGGRGLRKALLGGAPPLPPAGPKQFCTGFPQDRPICSGRCVVGLTENSSCEEGSKTVRLKVLNIHPRTYLQNVHAASTLLRFLIELVSYRV